MLLAQAEASLFLEAFKSLVAAGPVAVVLGTMCWKLWNRMKEKEEEHKTEIKEKDKIIERQHEKTLKVAVRTQRALEIIGGLGDRPTEVEEAFDDYNDKGDLRDSTEPGRS